MARLIPLLMMMIVASAGSLMMIFDVLGVRSVLIGIFTGPGSVSRIVALVLILTNLKVFPFVWHIRIFNAVFQHFFLGKSNAPSGPAALFQPIVTSSRAPVLECDYNLHKSNSTFFADLDVTRIHLLARLFGKGITKLRKTPSMVSGPDGVPAKGKLMIILGGTHCSFRREIKPLQAYEMWSRVLAWDQKWIYIVTHFVKPGGSIARKNKNKTQTATEKTPPAPDSNRVLASAVSKYVLKLDRLTIHPEVLLHASDLLPPKPSGWNTMSTMSSIPPPAPSPSPSLSSWTHVQTEARKEQGLKYAQNFGALDGLHEHFSEGEEGVLGRYRDL
ncbi:hypothetical protein MMC07_001989 [Pseudocyphellaria aurata]|nr:hypothetical protein [Pseudocyphellaria aurata]